jgi:hypothetical protein
MGTFCMGTETVKLISAAAAQILRMKAATMTSRKAIQHSRRLIRESMVRCKEGNATVALARNKQSETISMTRRPCAAPISENDSNVAYLDKELKIVQLFFCSY